MSLPRLLSNWNAEPGIARNFDALQFIPAHPARYEPLPDDLQPALKSALRLAGIPELYSHQADAWRRTQAGEHIVVITGTASGKTLCYNLPVLDRLLRDPQARALYLFPTKALAQDQLASLDVLTGSLRTQLGPNAALPGIGVYDGDTPAHQRPAIRKNARLVLSNPDMLHTGILPHHTNWSEFFANLRFVVIDEIHVYRGVFGSHVANVLRRLKRVAAFYGAFPQFVLTSATIANPAEFARKLVEQAVALVDKDGAARGPKQFVIYNPPIVDQDTGLRRSALQESVRLADDLLAYNVQTILFGRSRRTVELILTYLRERAAGDSVGDLSNPQEQIRGYRSGYLPQQRRAIERGLRQGQVRAVVATNALELGIDIGQMGAALLVGYPGTIAATWQQAGRAGRGQETSLAVLVATADPLDQFLASHPDYLFERSPESALINPDNLLILLEHLRCAAFELPFRRGDRFGNLPPDQVAEFLDFLSQGGELHASGERYFWMADQYPAQAVSLRSASSDTIQLQVWGPETENEGAAPTVIGQVDRISATWLVHPQAIYLHEGRSYYVEELDLEQKTAKLRPNFGDFYTLPRQETTVTLVDQYDQAPVTAGAKAHGEIQVTTQLVGYRKVRWYTHENLGTGTLEMPPSELLTTGYWLSLAPETVDRLADQGLWSNAPNRYGPNWATQRDLARQRDEYRCRICGALENGRSHHVHHLTPFRAFSSYLEANQLANLITVCPSCHRRVEANVRVRSGLAGLAFTLGHLAPLFLMCDTSDLGVHSDPQSALADGQPAVVIYDHIPAGIGFSQRLFEIHDELVLRAYELVASCKCSDGCPSCVGPGGENGSGGKQEALAILKELRD
jgi:DEAD/DEAH box helicase domain-containing protein